MKMNVSLLVSKKTSDVNPDEYRIGWLYIDEKESLWSTWGSCKNKNKALEQAKEVIKVRGKTDVFVNDTPLPEKLTKEQVLCLKQLDVVIKKEVIFN